MTRSIVLGGTLLAIHAAALGQQYSNPDFAPSVEHPAYSAGGPVVAVDRAHANFHTLDGKYAPLGRLLGADGYRVRPFTEAFTASALNGVNILVVSNARAPEEGGSAFSDAEIAAVQTWVEQGGSLFLIADHAPFGTAASRLAEGFGVNMGVGYVLDRSDDKISPQIRFEGSKLGKHPILAGRYPSERIRSVESFTGQSIGIAPGVTGLLLLSRNSIEVAGHADVETLMRGGKTAARRAAGRAQAVAFNFGRGRVVIAGEAAMFTEQVFPGMGRVGLTVDDDQQFALNVLHWLSRLI